MLMVYSFLRCLRSAVQKLVMVDYLINRDDRLGNYEWGRTDLVVADLVGMALLFHIFIWYAISRDYLFVRAFSRRGTKLDRLIKVCTSAKPNTPVFHFSGSCSTGPQSLLSFSTTLNMTPCMKTEPNTVLNIVQRIITIPASAKIFSIWRNPCLTHDRQTSRAL